MLEIYLSVGFRGDSEKKFWNLWRNLFLDTPKNIFLCGIGFLLFAIQKRRSSRYART